MKFLNTCIVIGCFVGFVACGSDEEDRAKTIVSESAEWSMLVDGDLVEGDKLEIRDTESNGTILKIYQSGGNEGIAFYFGSESVKANEYETGVGQFYARHFAADTLFAIDGGILNVTKMNSDSFEATFDLGISDGSLTPDFVITEGVIKAKLR